MESHLQKLKLCFQKCREYDNSLNPDKFAFMVFLAMIFSFIVSKEGKLPDPKKRHAIVNMLPPKNPQLSKQQGLNLRPLQKLKNLKH